MKINYKSGPLELIYLSNWSETLIRFFLCQSTIITPIQMARLYETNTCSWEIKIYGKKIRMVEMKSKFRHL